MLKKYYYLGKGKDKIIALGGTQIVKPFVD
jgi:hypothetical protein